MYKPKTSEAAVVKATGKGWSEWFRILDRAGAKTKGHREIVAWVYDNYLGKKGKGTINVVSPTGWWSQMVTVEYERSRGLRLPNQNEDGFLVGVHKTFAYSRAEFLKRWTKLVNSRAVVGKKLLPTPTRSKRPMLRYKAHDGILVVTMDDRPGGKVRVMVEAARLKAKASVERERAFWKRGLASLE